MEDTHTENEDIIEDITEEQLANEEVEQDTEDTSEESAVTESDLTDSIKDILLGEKAKKEGEHDDEEEDEDEVEEGAHDDDDDKKKKDVKEAAKSKKEGEHEDDEDEDEDEKDVKESTEDLEEATKADQLKDAYMKLKAMKKADLKGAYEGHCENTAAAKTLSPGASKLEILNAMYKEMQKMTKSNLVAAVDGLAKYQDDKQKAAFKGESKEITAALNTLIENDSNLSEDFKVQASTLFEAAIAKKATEIKEDLEIQYQEDLQEELNGVRDVLVEKIDNYLSYVVESWIEENEAQVTSTLRADIAENFISSLKDIFVENYIEVPEEKRDLVAELADKSEEQEEKLTEASLEIEMLKDQVEGYERDEIISEMSQDLSGNEAHKLREILEDIDFSDKESFTSKVKVIKSSLFSIKEETSTEEVVEEDTTGETEVIIEGEGDPMEKLPKSMKAYLSAISKLNK
jgi:hypothetical protein